MNTVKFLHQVSDKHGPLQMIAAETIERMTPEDFMDLCNDMERLICMVNTPWKAPRTYRVNPLRDRHPETTELLEGE